MHPNSKTQLTGLESWLHKVPDNTKLSKIALPGTHNSAACYISFPSVRCQEVSVTEQLQNGVRFLDIRAAAPYLSSCGAVFGRLHELQVIHGDFPVRLPFPVKLKSVLDEIYDFLDHNKSETVIVSLKPEGPHHFHAHQFSDIIWDEFIVPRADKWHLKNDIPTIGEVRGKAILFRRFGISSSNDSQNFGIDAASWKYNTIEDEPGFLSVQDWCEVMVPADIAKKVTYINDHLKRAIEYNSTAKSDENCKLYINFFSGSNSLNHKCWPRKVSQGLVGVTQSLGKSCGIVVIDFANANDWEIARTVIALNL
jgi:1-phosphatidylinositol phosphodiesterase